MSALSRRGFARLAGTAALGTPLVGQRKLITAGEVVERIRHSVGVPWQEKTLDAIKAGDPQDPVHGIATTAMATMDVLRRAAREMSNLVITLEPVFFGRLDGQPQCAGRGQGGVRPDDPLFLAKSDFIRKNGLVIFRFTDHWRLRQPDPMATGLAQALGWRSYQVKDDPFRYDLPGGSLGALAETLQKRLKARAGIRVVGDPAARVRRLVMLPGLSALAATIKELPESDVILAGETREWESVEYAADTVAAGHQKGFIMLGRVLSEDPGMNVCAEWLKTLVPEAPVRWLPAGDPYWRPA